MSNSTADIKKYFSTIEKPVSASELMEFWKSLSEEEKEYYREVELS